MKRMNDSLLEQEIPVYSEKYDIHGVIKDYGVVIKLFFSYNGKDICMGISRPFGRRKPFEEAGRELIESYVSSLAAHDGKQKLQLHYWYIDERDYEGEKYTFGHGIVTGHQRLMDSTYMHTSEVRAIRVDEENKELILITRNSVYHCPLAYCRYKKQDSFPDIIPEYEELKKEYQGTIEIPSIEPGKVLLVLADFCEYYFHSIFYIPKDSEQKEPLDYNGRPHIGMFTDSFLVDVEGADIDLRYFPHFRNIEFYMMITDECPIYLQNIGDTVLYASTHCGKIRLEPGDRKEVTKANAEPDPPALPDGDLYPAVIMDGGNE